MFDPEKLQHRIYLGDGVYAGYDGYQIWLHLQPGEVRFHSEIALPAEVMGALDKYAKELPSKLMADPEFKEIVWLLLHPQASPENLGFLPEIFLGDDESCLVDQLNARYQHGGGFSASPGWTKGEVIGETPQTGPIHLLIGSSGETFYPVAAFRHRHEVGVLYTPSEFFGIFNDDGTFQVCRVS